MSFLQANTNSLQMLSKPPLHSKAKIIKHAKELRPKLERILEPHMTAVIGSETEYSEGFKNSNNNLRYIFTKYQSYYNVVHDGNEIFRILGIHHIQSIMDHKEKVTQFCSDFLQSKIEANVLTDIPSEYQKHCLKQKIVKIYQVLLVSLQKKKIAGGFYKNIASLLNAYKIFDFALVAFYRLYTYIFGLLTLQSVDEMKLEQRIVLGYEKEADSDIINIICECLAMKVDVYNISDSNVQLTRYGSNLVNTQIQYSHFIFFKFNHHYALAEQKSQAKIKQQEQILAELGKDDLTISEIFQKKNTSSQQNLTDRKSLWEVDIDIPSSILPDIRPRRYTQKLTTRMDEISSSFINQFGMRSDSLKEKLSELCIRKTETVIEEPITKKTATNLNICKVLNQFVQPQQKGNTDISEQDMDMGGSKKDQSLYRKQGSRISSKAGSIRKQSVLSNSLSNSSMREEERKLQTVYNQLSENERKSIVMLYLRNRLRLESEYSGELQRCQSKPLSSNALIIQTKDMSISITRN